MRTLHNIDLKNNESGFTLRWQDRLILSHPLPVDRRR